MLEWAECLQKIHDTLNRTLVYNITFINISAEVVELVDAPDSKSGAGNKVRVKSILQLKNNSMISPD
jgi:hypothetical protein